MTREEALEAMAWEISGRLGYHMGDTRPVAMASMRARGEWAEAVKLAEAALSSLTPLLQGVVEALEPVAAYVEVIDARDHKPLDDATMMAAMTGDKTPDGGTLFQVITAGSLRAASTAHARMKELVDG